MHKQPEKATMLSVWVAVFLCGYVKCGIKGVSLLDACRTRDKARVPTIGASYL